MDERLRSEVIPLFWSSLQENVSDKSSPLHSAFPSAVSVLYSRAGRLNASVHRLESLANACQTPCEAFGQKSYYDLYKLMIRATLHSQLPDNNALDSAAEAFYERAFQVYYTRQQRNWAKQNEHNADSSEADEPSSDCADIEGCNGCASTSKDSCLCEAILAEFSRVNRCLAEMGALECLATNALTKIVRLRIDKQVEETCRGSFTREHLDPLLDWLEGAVLVWLKLVFAGERGGLENDGVVDSFRQRLRHHLHDRYAKTRIDQLFNIIVEFSDSAESKPALDDLRKCVEHLNGLREKLIKELKELLSRKLLHHGVRTTDILTAYVAAIKALRVLDPTGVILELVSDPVRAYLRGREDTVRCIVQSLIDETNNEMADELREHEGLCLDDSFYEEEDMSDWQNWEPDPVHADPERHSQSRRRSDIISMLVNIYGSKELFVNEYRGILSNRLLSHFTYDAEREIRNLELLKLRFGEAPLHQCEVRRFFTYFSTFQSTFLTYFHRSCSRTLAIQSASTRCCTTHRRMRARSSPWSSPRTRSTTRTSGR